MDQFISFFADRLPGARTILVAGPVALFWAYLCLYIAGSLKAKRGLKTGYTRKVFHFLVFASVGAIHLAWGLPLVLLFGAATSCVIFYAVLRGRGHLLYDAIGRETDHPHSTLYIIIPYLATLIGGVTSNFLFGPLALTGYLVTGIGDAVGEPVGTRFGRHKYKVPSLVGPRSERSYEGSAAVFLASAFAISLTLLFIFDLALTPRNLVAVPLLALACTVVEAGSPRGWDNLTMQIVPAFLAKLWLS